MAAAQVGKGTLLGYAVLLADVPTNVAELKNAPMPKLSSGTVAIEKLEGDYELKISDETKMFDALSINTNWTEAQYISLLAKVGDTDIWTLTFPSGGKVQFEAILTDNGGDTIARKGAIPHTFTLTPTNEEVASGVVLKYTAAP